MRHSPRLSEPRAHDAAALALVIGLAGMLPGCASVPPRPTGSPAAPAQPVPGTAPGQAPVAAPSERPDPELIREGYHFTRYRGHAVYCRMESPTGSRFSSKVCLTAEQIRERERAAKEALGTVRPDSTCVQMPSICN